MMTKQSMLYSLTAAKRIAGNVVAIKVWWKVIWVWVRGKRPTLISKKVFREHFVSHRRAQARALQATQHLLDRNWWTVYNSRNDNRYNLQLTDNVVICTCDDYKNQIEFFGKGCCKHGYAILWRLGHNSLEDWVNRDRTWERVPDLEHAPIFIPPPSTKSPRGRSID